MHLDKTCKIEFFKEHQNSTNPKELIMCTDFRTFVTDFFTFVTDFCTAACLGLTALKSTNHFTFHM